MTAPLSGVCLQYYIKVVLGVGFAGCGLQLTCG